MGLLAWAVKGLIGLVVLLLAVGAIAYALDAPIEATVTQTTCAGGSANPFFPTLAPAAGQDSSVTVRTKFLGIDHTVAVDRTTCVAVRPDNFVVYHLRSGHTVLYEDASKANCIYDSQKGVC